MFWFTVMAKINDACKNKNRISWAIANSDYTRENYYDAMSKSIYIKYNSIYLMSVLKTYVIEVQAGNLI